MTRWLVGVLGAVMAWGVIALPAEAQGKKKVAMILPGTVQDADFNTLGYVALQDLAKTLDVEVAHSENVAMADAERVSREYIASGHDVVAYHGGQFITIMQKLAAQFPKVTFIQEASGRIPNAPANVWVIGRKYYQGFYALGALAALSTKANKIGLVGGVRAFAASFVETPFVNPHVAFPHTSFPSLGNINEPHFGQNIARGSWTGRKNKNVANLGGAERDGAARSS